MFKLTFWTLLTGLAAIGVSCNAASSPSKKLKVDSTPVIAPRRNPAVAFYVIKIYVKDLVDLKNNEKIDSLVFQPTNPVQSNGASRHIYTLIAIKSTKYVHKEADDLLHTVGDPRDMLKDSDGVDVKLGNYNFNYGLSDIPEGASYLLLTPVLGDNVPTPDNDSAFNNYVRYQKIFYDSQDKPINGSTHTGKWTSGSGGYLNPSPPA